MKTLVITGAAGEIGGAIVDKFLSSGVKVIGLDIHETVSTLSSNPNYQGFVFI
jgi:nucleoside-diphosphate-sugar epimerase